MAAQSFHAFLFSSFVAIARTRSLCEFRSTYMCTYIRVYVYVYAICSVNMYLSTFAFTVRMKRTINSFLSGYVALSGSVYSIKFQWSGDQQRIYSKFGDFLVTEMHALTISIKKITQFLIFLSKTRKWDYCKAVGAESWSFIAFTKYFDHTKKGIQYCTISTKDHLLHCLLFFLFYFYFIKGSVNNE